MAGGAGLLLAAAAATSLIPPRGDAGAEVARLTTELAARQADVDRLTTTLAVRDQLLASLNATVADRDATLDGLKVELADATAAIEALKRELAAERGKLALGPAPAADATAPRRAAAERGTPEPKLAIFAPDPAPAALIAMPADPAALDRVFAAKSAPPLPARGSDEVQVHFDFASALLSPGGQAHAAAAAVVLAGQPLERIRVVGHTDRVGSPAANRRLAEKRARAVADFLVASGIPADLIEVDGMGEAEAPVATDDGVPEPLNRSVAIVAVPLPIT